MPEQPKTIQIFLPQGNPRGIRVSEITTRTVKLIEIPRPRLELFFNMSEAEQVGLYFLIGSNEENNERKAYIGQTGELRKRLGQHNKNKESWDWQRAFVMLSTNNTITQTHALYLEYKAIETAINAERYTLMNGNNGMLPHTPAPLQADCEELFHTLSILLSTMGQPIFESLQVSEPTPISVSQQSDSPKLPEKEIFFCRNSFANAKGYYDDDGFVILKESLIRKDTVQSLNNWAIERRNELLEQGKLVLHDNKYYKFTENYLCNTPSGAAQMVLGRPSNGWIEWTNKKGETLDSVYRQPNNSNA